MASILGKRKASRCTRVPEGQEGQGWTVRPAGLATTQRALSA